MKITVCKEVKYKPVGISSMASLKDTIVIFRKNKTVELVQNISYSVYSRLELDSVVIQSTFISEKDCLILGEDGSLKILDIGNLKVSKIDLEYNLVSFEGDYKPSTPLICYTKNVLIVAVDLKGPAKVVQKINRPVSCILQKGGILIGDQKGRITVLGSSEIEIGKDPINQILHIKEDKFIALCGGSLVYFDVSLCIVLQRIPARDSPLSCGVFLKGLLHVVGEDSRIVCFRLVKDVFQKSFQADKHILGVSSLCCIGDTLFTGGLDGIMGIFIPTDTRYTALRVFDYTPTGKITKEVCGVPKNRSTLVFINNCDFGEIYKLGNTFKNINELESSFKNTVKLDKKYFEDLAVKKVKFTNQLRLYFKNKVFCSDSDGRILVYSDSLSSKLVEISPKVQKDLCFAFPPAKVVFLTPSKIILQNLDFKIRIIDRLNFEDVQEIKYSDLTEEIIVLEDSIYFKKSKEIYNFVENHKINFTLEGIVMDIVKVNESLIVLAKNDLVTYTLYRGVGSKDQSYTRFSTYDIIKGLVVHNGDIYYKTSSSLTNSNNGHSYEVGSIVYASGSIGTSLFVLKDDWSYLQDEMGESIVKPRWKSR